MHEAYSNDTILRGACVLVVEDDFLIALELASILAAAGADVVGPSRTVREALARIDHGHVTAAILDVRLGGDTADPVARGLSARRIPFFFYTGQGNDDPICRRFPASEVISKPASPQTLVAAVTALVGRSASLQALGRA